MCGIAGLIYKNGRDTIGPDMTRMLQSMKHRGPDSTGYALYGAPSDDWVMRVKLADANTPRDYEFADRLLRNKAEIERRLAHLGATVHSIEDATEYAFEAHFSYDGDLKALEKDELIRDSAMPGRLWKVFHHYKQDEWERYLAAVTDWERDEYLEVLP